MADALDSIFSAIIKSEMIAQVEKKKHKEVKDGIEQLKMRLQKQDTLKAEHLSKRDSLELALADTNIGLKVFKVREECLTKELSIMGKKLKMEKNRYDDVNRNMSELCKELIENANKFSRDYGLSSSGIERRMHSAKDCLRSLDTEKEKLDLDVQTTVDFNNDLKRIIDEKSNKIDELKVITSQFDDLEKSIHTETNSTNEFERKISVLITEPDHGSDFGKVKEELQKYETTKLHSEINQLEAELQSLTKKFRKKEAQALRLQYKHWQRQQHQKSQNSCKKESSSRSEHYSGTTGSANEIFFENSNSMELGDMTVCDIKNKHDYLFNERNGVINLQHCSV